MSQSENTRWRQEAVAAAKRANAYNIEQVVNVLDGICIDDLDDWCSKLKQDYPCLFTVSVRKGL